MSSRPLVPKYVISTGFRNSDEVAQTAGMINSSLGSTYTSPNDLLGIELAPKSKIFIARSEPHEDVYGAAILNVYDGVEAFIGEAPEDQRDHLRRWFSPRLANARVGVLKTVVVDPNLRGLGIGKKLCRTSINHLVGINVSSVISMGWTDHQGCHIEGTLESTGFTMLEELKNYFHQLSVDLGFDCSSCGNPCVCSIKLFERTL